MEASQHPLNINLRHRYYTLGSLNPQTPAIWMVCHGYGQLARYFIRHFQVLANAGHFIIAPEGLSRFYLQGFTGRVGASWMSREARETDINNTVHYLNQVYMEQAKDHPAPLRLLGFSQGVATISRWAALAAPAFEELVLWGGLFPEDLPLEQASGQLQNKKITLVFGDEDPFLTGEKKQAQLVHFKNIGLNPRLIQYKGAHGLKPDVLITHFTT